MTPLKVATKMFCLVGSVWIVYILYDTFLIQRDTGKILDSIGVIRKSATKPPFLSDPDIQRVLSHMQHRRDSMRRFNEIHLKCDSFWTLHSLANGDSAWAFYYVDSVNYYWHIVQKERAAQEKKIVRLKQ